MHRVYTQIDKDRAEDGAENDNRRSGIQKHAHDKQQDVDQKQQCQRVVGQRQDEIRDNYMGAEEAKDFGLVDQVVETRKKVSE